VVVSVHVGRFLARFAGSLKAVASLPEDMRKKITTEDKGEVTVPVVVTDEVRRSAAFPTSFVAPRTYHLCTLQSGQSPIQCEMVWAWVPKRK
jgi:enterochelin esterase-like enzyme